MYHSQHPFIVNITRCGTDIKKASGVTVPPWSFLSKATTDQCKQCSAYFELDRQIDDDEVRQEASSLPHFDGIERAVRKVGGRRE